MMLELSAVANLPTLQNGSECCPVSGLSQITSISYYDATAFASDLGRIGEVTLNAETCVLVDCYDDGGGLMACNFVSCPP